MCNFVRVDFAITQMLISHLPNQTRKYLDFTETTPNVVRSRN